jgi:hypothetical protein
MVKFLANVRRFSPLNLIVVNKILVLKKSWIFFGGRITLIPTWLEPSGNRR